MGVDLNTGPPCTCNPGQCEHFVEEHNMCIYRIGYCKTLWCPPCQAFTWHDRNDKCLREPLHHANI